MRFFLVTFLALLILLTGQFLSADVYSNDSSARIPITESDAKLGLVSVHRDAGLLISQDLVLTASHSIRGRESYHSDGTAMLPLPYGNVYYYKILEVVEESQSLDYAIVRISWDNKKVPPGISFIKELDLLDEQRYGNKVIPENIYALGCPWDKQKKGCMRSNGTKVALITKTDPATMLFNAGVGEGNSGGPLFDHEGGLLGIVNGGPHSVYDQAFENNDPENMKAWNYAVPIGVIFKQSKTLQKLFPNGKR